MLVFSISPTPTREEEEVMVAALTAAITTRRVAPEPDPASPAIRPRWVDAGRRDAIQSFARERARRWGRAR